MKLTLFRDCDVARVEKIYPVTSLAEHRASTLN